MENKYIIGCDPASGESSIGVLSIHPKDGEPVIIKINPCKLPDYQHELLMTYTQLVEIYKDILTEEDINKLKNF